MAGVRSGLVALLSGVVVAGMVSAPPVAGAGSGVRGSAPQVAVPAVGSGVVVPLATSRKRPTVRLRSGKRLVVDVDPNLSGSKSWKFVLAHKSGGVWSKVGVYRTRGRAEVRRFRVEPGKYRVRVRARPGYQSVTTQGYWHTPTVVTTRISVHTDGSQARGTSGSPEISADGRWITYTSKATNLVDNDTNATGDVFLFDRETERTRRVSVRTDGGQADGGSYSPAISADGRWITYISWAANLVEDDTNSVGDVFLFDRVTGQTSRVSLRTDGGQADGGSYYRLGISADGRWITYTSWATNLVDDDTNNAADVFLFDRDTGTTERVSVRSDGGQVDYGGNSPAISADGRWITYTSGSTNLVDDDTNNASDVFLLDRETGLVERVSVRSDGGQAEEESMDPAISADGRWITYHSHAANLVDNDTNHKHDVFLFDRQTGRTERVSVRTGGGQATGGDSDGPATISADGRWITYGSSAVNLVNNDTNRTSDGVTNLSDVFLTRMW